jgi:phosphatidylglycerophosphate synthase
MLRSSAIVLSMVSDGLDGYIARRTNSTSKLGTLLDPIMDKFFVYFGLTVFLLESKLSLLQAFAMVSRDFAIGIFGLYLILTKKYSTYTIHSFRLGKLSTALQFFVLIALSWNISISWYLYALFIFLGLFALIELFKESSKTPPSLQEPLEKTTK